MRWAKIALLTLGLGLFGTSLAHAEGAQTHVVAKGQTLGRIAKRYNVTIAALCKANHIRRTSPIVPGQKLVIPGDNEETSSSSAPVAHAEGAQTHVVAKGQTLAHIAKRYNVTIAALCKANHIRRTSPIVPGQKLIIPGTGGETSEHETSHVAEEHHAPLSGGMKWLDVPGAPPAYYYTPTGRGHLGLRPVIMYLHGRGGHPERACQRWAHVARRFGWVVCPSGPEDRGGGARGWANNWAAGERIVMATLHALRKKYGRRVQLYGNTLIGFSEGAFVAMNVGVREPHTFNRWLILAADNDYWGAAGLEALQKDRARLRRVYLITGEQDGTYDGTKQVKEWLKHAGIPTIVRTPKDMGHEVALEHKPAMYRSALRWLDHGARPRHRPTAHRSDPDHGRKR